MRLIPLTKTSHLLPYAEYLKQYGQSVEPYLAECKLPTKCLEDPNTVVPAVAGRRFRELISRKTGLPNLSMNVTTNLKFCDFGIYGESIIRKPTLYRAILAARDLIHTQASTVRIELDKVNEETYEIKSRFVDAPEAGGWHSNLYVLRWMLHIVRLTTPSWSPRQIWTSSSHTPERSEALLQLGAATPVFNQDTTGFFIPARMMPLPMNKSLFDFKPTEPIDDPNLFQPIPAEQFSNALRQVIFAYQKEEWLRIDQSAEILGTSVRTIQRRLSEEHEDYMSIIEDVRYQLAIRLLTQTDNKMSEVAQELGYNNQTNFTRAFKRWAGVSPKAYRNEMRK